MHIGTSTCLRLCVCVLILPIPNISLYMNSSNIKMDYINAWVIFNVTAIA